MVLKRMFIKTTCDVIQSKISYSNKQMFILNGFAKQQKKITRHFTHYCQSLFERRHKMDASRFSPFHTTTIKILITRSRTNYYACNKSNPKETT